MKDIFDLFAEGVVTEEEEISRDVLESVIIEEAVDKISMLSEGVIKKLGVKILSNPTRQARMIDGKPVNSGTSTKYTIQDVHREIECVEEHLKNNKDLTDEQRKNFKEYLSKLKNRYKELGGGAALSKAKDKDIEKGLKRTAAYIGYKHYIAK